MEDEGRVAGRGAGREAVRMTDDEVAAFLAAGRTMSVATIEEDGRPHLVAMWYVVLDGQVCFWTYGRSRKAGNLRRDPRLTCMVEAGDRYEELRGVSIAGRATLLDDGDAVRRVGAAVADKYLLADVPEGEGGAAVRDAVTAGVAAQAPKRVAVRVTAERTASWDHRKRAADG